MSIHKITKIEHVSCNLCGEDDTRLLYSIRDNILDSSMVFHVVQCQKCGLVFTNPRPTRETIEKFYPASYFPLAEGRRKGGVVNKIKMTMRHLVAESHFGYKIKDRPLLIKNILWYFTLIWKNSLSFLPPHSGPGEILDIGCGTGEYLEILKEYGWDVYGIDTSKRAVEIASAKGIKTFCGDLEDANYEESIFDVVCFHQSLEHIHDPFKVLKETHRILKKSGLLLIDVPNFDSVWRNIFGSSWHTLDVPRHLFHFTPHTISMLLEKSNFTVKHLETKGYSLGIEHYFHFKKITPTFTHKEKKILNMSVDFGNLAGRIGAGDNIYVHAVPIK